jgi:hypothetical protein
MNSRTLSLLLLLAVAAMLGVHHWYVVTEQRAFLFALFLLPPFGMLALGGVFYPPLLISIGKYGKDLPVAVKTTGWLLATAGVAIGFWLFKYVYAF